MEYQKLKDWVNAHCEDIQKKSLLDTIDAMQADADYEARIRICTFDKQVEPLMLYLAKNHHPHTTIILTATTAELVEGICVHNTDKFLVD